MSRQKITSLLTPVDGSPNATRALEQAVEPAGLPIVPLHCFAVETPNWQIAPAR